MFRDVDSDVNVQVLLKQKIAHVQCVTLRGIGKNFSPLFKQNVAGIA